MAVYGVIAVLVGLLTLVTLTGLAVGLPGVDVPAGSRPAPAAHLVVIARGEESLTRPYCRHERLAPLLTTSRDLR
jgi:hypothetical protein